MFHCKSLCISPVWDNGQPKPEHLNASWKHTKYTLWEKKLQFFRHQIGYLVHWNTVELYIISTYLNITNLSQWWIINAVEPSIKLTFTVSLHPNVIEISSRTLYNVNKIFDKCRYLITVHHFLSYTPEFWVCCCYNYFHSNRKQSFSYFGEEDAN